MNNDSGDMAGYRRLKPGEVIEKTDEYLSIYYFPGCYIPVCDCSVGQGILPCNIKYYRRPIWNGDK